jgi:hypothetical protein
MCIFAPSKVNGSKRFLCAEFVEIQVNIIRKYYKVLLHRIN